MVWASSFARPSELRRGRLFWKTISSLNSSDGLATLIYLLIPSYSCLAGMESGAGREDVFGDGGKAPDALSTDSKTQKRGS